MSATVFENKTSTTKNHRIWTKMFGHLSEWNLFERIWLATFTIVNIWLFFAMKDSILGLISSLAGMLCVVLVAKGKISNYFFGLIQVVLYGWISFTYGLYGETILNWAFYVPIQFIGFWMWSRNSKKSSEKNNPNNRVVGEEIRAKRLTGVQLAVLLIGSAILIAAYAWFLATIGGRAVGLDSATNVLSIVAQFLMLARYAEQWLLWIIVDILSISMWAWVLITQDGTAWTQLVMWTAFLVNGIYGYHNWLKMAREQDLNKNSETLVKEGA